jgi:protein subunit release factor B
MADGFSQLDDLLRRRLAAVGVRPEDVEERFIRGSGHGGQKINKTSSCVCLRHVPTGIEVRCQRERSQVVNRALAWAGLCEKLEARRHAAAAMKQDERQKNIRRHRQKSYGQKVRMIEAKKHHAKIKTGRGRVGAE